MKFFIFPFFLFFTFSLQAQTANKIHGKISNSETKQSLQGATIILLEQNIATNSNENGEFIIFSNTEKQKLIISYVGFERYSININKIDSNNLLHIYLRPKDVEIRKIVINPYLSTSLIKNALLQVPHNYPDTAMSFVAFFRETVMQDDSVILQIEAFVEIYKAPYNSKKRDKMKFLQARTTKNEKNSELWDYLFFVNAPYELLYADVARYPKSFIQIPEIGINFLKEDHFKYYNYKTTSNEKNKFFIIEFYPNPDKRRGVFKGKLIIEKESFAIISMEYEYAENKINRINNYPSLTEISLSKEGVYIPETYFYSKIDYIKLNKKWHINSVVNEYSFLFQIGNKKEMPIITVKDELRILEVKENVDKIRFLEEIIKGTNMTEQLPRTDSVFWKKFDSKKM